MVWALSIIPVRTLVGQMMFERMLCGAPSIATSRMSPTTPCLLISYGAGRWGSLSGLPPIR